METFIWLSHRIIIISIMKMVSTRRRSQLPSEVCVSYLFSHILILTPTTSTCCTWFSPQQIYQVTKVQTLITKIHQWHQKKVLGKNGIVTKEENRGNWQLSQKHARLFRLCNASSLGGWHSGLVMSLGGWLSGLVRVKLYNAPGNRKGWLAPTDFQLNLSIWLCF